MTRRMPLRVWLRSLLLLVVLSGASLLGGAVERFALAQVVEVQREVVVLEDTEPLRAPVLDAPSAGRVYRGDRIFSEVEVSGEPIDGNWRWHLVTFTYDGLTYRGFVHSSLLRYEDENENENENDNEREHDNENQHGDRLDLLPPIAGGSALTHHS